MEWSYVRDLSRLVRGGDAAAVAALVAFVHGIGDDGGRGSSLR